MVWSYWWITPASAEAVEYVDCTSAGQYDSFLTWVSLGMTLNWLEWWGFWTLENVEYFFITITSRSTQTHRDSIC